jgi:hypothetical protein
MKTYRQFLSENITINGDFNGTLTYGGAPGKEQQKESFFADVVWEGKIYRLEIEGKMLSKNELAEQIQSEYPGAIVHQIYPGEAPSKIKSSKRYQPERLTWSD